MSDVEACRLLHSRHFCIDRLVEVKEELARIQAEDLELKSRLDGAGETEADLIRRRRRHLSRRVNELKAERAALAAELQESTDKLRMMHQG